MPIHEYECCDEECGHITEIEQPITEDIPAEIRCEKCDNVSRKVLSGCTFRLKGAWPGKYIKRGLDY
jgi:putative FmdB family regulatory protein